VFDRAALRDLYDYTEFTWETYRRVSATLPADALSRPVEGSEWPALRNALFHIACAWDGWLRDRLGADDPLDATPDDISSWEDLQLHRDRTRDWLRRVIDETPDDALAAETEVMFAGTAPEMNVSVGAVLTHILLHERGHHGDVTTLFSQLGATPPGIDYLTYLFFKKRRPAP
jgi:uncharacterized damage-inducible protein DinB